MDFTQKNIFRYTSVIGVVVTGLALAACTPTATPPNTNTQSAGATTKKIDQTLVGSWKSNCVVPDPKVEFSEQHTFMFDASGNAFHTRKTFDNKNCTDAVLTEADNYTYTIPRPGEINFLNLGTQVRMYDIFVVTKTQLEFGHGLRKAGEASETGGTSKTDRFSTLNTAIVYTAVLGE